MDQSIFYATSGGQPGDNGWLKWNGKSIEIDETVNILNPEVIVQSFHYHNSNEDPNLSMNNTSVVVPKNEPQVSSAEIKVTGTTLAYARALQNPYLSITNKKIPPELSRIG